MMNLSYLSLYVILDTDYLNSLGKSYFTTLRSCLKGGATCIQLRSKTMTDDIFYHTALKIQKICASYKVPLIINDRVAIAVLINADGVHVGKEDLPYSQVKKIFKGIIGLSADNIKEARSLDALHASYIGVGPVYPTEQKNKKALGIKKIKIINQSLLTPVVAIGGINEYNISALKRSGIKYFSFISGILGSKDILAQTKKVKFIIYHKE